MKLKYQSQIERNMMQANTETFNLNNLLFAQQ
jgi:hypothetical protein